MKHDLERYTLLLSHLLMTLIDVNYKWRIQVKCIKFPESAVASFIKRLTKQRFVDKSMNKEYLRIGFLARVDILFIPIDHTTQKTQAPSWFLIWVHVQLFWGHLNVAVWVRFDACEFKMPQNVKLMNAVLLTRFSSWWRLCQEAFNV